MFATWEALPRLSQICCHGGKVRSQGGVRQLSMEQLLGSFALVAL